MLLTCSSAVQEPYTTLCILGKARLLHQAKAFSWASMSSLSIRPQKAHLREDVINRNGTRQIRPYLVKLLFELAPGAERASLLWGHTQPHVHRDCP